MFRKFGLPTVAVIGVVFAVIVVLKSAKPVPASQPVAQPASAPFAQYVAGAGLVEARTENIAISVGVGGIVTDVWVRVGDAVKKGQPLFQIWDKSYKANVQSAQAAVRLSEAKLEKLMRSPRPEDVPPAEARVKEAQAALSDAQAQLKLWESVTDKRAVSEDDLSKRRWAVAAAEARLTEAQAQLNLLKAGAWKSDIDIAQAELASAKAAADVAEAELDRLTIKAPTDAKVLQVKVRPGEFAQPGPLATPLMVLGEIDTLHVRVDVDENDAWRLKAGSRALAYVRGNRDLKTELRFVRIEPYVVPKKSLTGESTERVDTRVLQVVYAFSREELPVYVGQQMDVFIETAK